MSDDTPAVTLHGFDCRPTEPASDPSAQAEELLNRLLIPMADILRAQKADGRTWHPGAIYLAFFRCGVNVLGTEWVTEGKAKMDRAWASLVPVLKEEADAAFETASKVYAEQLKGAKTTTH